MPTVHLFARDHINTDEIIPARHLTTDVEAELAKYAMEDYDKDFVRRVQPGDLIVAGADFGCGSSREHAVWALRDYGFKAVLSSRFADIFRGNAGKQGLVAAVLSQSDIEQIWKILENQPGAEVTVDLEARTVTCDTLTVPFQIDDYTRWRLLEGLDDIGLTLQDQEAIKAFENTYRQSSPWLFGAIK